MSDVRYSIASSPMVGLSARSSVSSDPTPPGPGRQKENLSTQQPSSPYVKTSVQEALGWSRVIRVRFCEAKKGKRLVVALLVVIMLGLLSVRVARGQTVINYPSGFNSAAVSSAAGGSGPIWMVESTQAGSRIQLTTIGTDHGVANAWYKTPVNIQGFATTFTFEIDCASGSPTNCSSGLGFMIICACTGGNPTYNPPTNPGFTYSGYSGNQFSWSQCSGVYNPQTGFPNTCVAINSILIKFDIFNMVTSTFGASLTGFCSDGIYCESPQNASYDMAPSGINLTSGHVFSATLTYDGSNLSETLTDTATGAQYAKTYTGVNLPSLLAGNTAFVGFGGGTGDTATESAYLNSWTYTAQSAGQAAAPVFSPVAGTYSTSQSVNLSTTSSGTVICYNTTESAATNGATGCNAGTLYTGPVAVPSTETLYAVAGGTGYRDSSTNIATYLIQASVAMPAFSPAAGTYNSAQAVIISDATSNATIYYTTDGTTPTASSTRYTAPITVSSTETLEAIAVAPSDSNSAVASAAYNISEPIVATPVFSPASGTYLLPQLVMISDATPGATIYYTTNGSAPTTSSAVYTGAITVSAPETLKAMAVDAGDGNSAVASSTYLINVPVAATPTFTPAAGAYTSAQSVSIADATSGANHLLYDQRNYSWHVLRGVYGPDRGRHDGDARGDRSRDR